MTSPLRVLVAPDSFKGTLTSVEVARAIADGWRQARPRDAIDLAPLADGGEGTPVAVEVPFGAVVAGVVIRGRMDAVFSRDSGFEVVDWKTGAAPTAPAEAAAVAVQLAAYRVAWARLAGVAVDDVSAAFFYVRDGTTVRPADLLDETQLVELITRLPPA